MSTLENARRILAGKIVEVLFSDGDRLEVKKKSPNHFRADENGELALGGWCKESAIDQVDRVLKEQSK